MARRWASLRQDQYDSIWDSGNWPKKIEQEMTAFAAQLKSRATVPEMLYFCTYIDQWSVGASIFHGLFHQTKLANGSTIISYAPLFVFYPLPDQDDLKTILYSCLREPSIREREPKVQEVGWFYHNLLEAVHAWEKLIPLSTLILMRESFDASPSDQQVQAACARPWASTPVANPNPQPSRSRYVPLG